jgi:hypothetical protein
VRVPVNGVEPRRWTASETLMGEQTTRRWSARVSTAALCMLVVMTPAWSAGEAGLVEDLGLRVNLDNEVEVHARSGGRLARLSTDEIALRTASGEQSFTRADLRQVAVRRRPLRGAVLIGGGIGAGIGLVVGALMPRASVVFPAEGGGRISVVPVLARWGRRPGQPPVVRPFSSGVAR